MSAAGDVPGTFSSQEFLPGQDLTLQQFFDLENFRSRFWLDCPDVTHDKFFNEGRRADEAFEVTVRHFNFKPTAQTQALYGVGEPDAQFNPVTNTWTMENVKINGKPAKAEYVGYLSSIGGIGLPVFKITLVTEEKK